MSCNGKGICGCGSPRCTENAWWFHWGGLWWLLAFEMCERIREQMTDDTIDSARKQAHDNP